MAETWLGFEGIDAPNTTPVPDIYFDTLFPELGKGSLKVLLYLVRRIFGFKKEGDTVSLSQICAGIRRRDGTTLDRGTGLTRQVVTTAVRELEELGVIAATRRLSEKGDPAPTYYTLRFREQLSVQDLLRQKAEAGAGYRFPGIDSPNTTPVPDIYFDLLLPELSLAEWRVLLYVVRRTLGFKKLSDAISLDQFTHGIARRDGSVLDRGTGLSRSNVHEALNRLTMRNVLVRQRVRDERTGDGVSLFSLSMREDVRLAMGIDPGPLRRAANEGPPDRVPEPDRHGDLESSRHGVPESDQVRGPRSDHPGVPQPDRPARHPSALGQGGSPGPDRRRGLETDHPGVPNPAPPESRKRTAGGADIRPPVAGQQAPQQTDPQQTAIQDPREGGTGQYEALAGQVAADLGVPHAGASGAAQIAALARASNLAGPDFLEALVAAWKTARTKQQQGALEHPSAAMAYFLAVLAERAAPRPPALPRPPPPARSPELQDQHFLGQVRGRLGALGDQGAWLEILRNLVSGMTQVNYTRWFARSAVLERDEELLVVVPDALQRDWLATRLRPVVAREAAACGEGRPLRFIALRDLPR